MDCPMLTHSEFAAKYRKMFWGDLWRALRYGSWWTRAFALRIRVPNGLGFYGPDAGSGSGWTVPWLWSRRYYNNRVKTGHI